MRRLTISLDIAFGKDEPAEEPYEPGQLGSADTQTERRHSDEHATRQVGFGTGIPWEDI
jgi:hypothetical protein